MKMKIDKNMKYALYFGGALVATYIVVKLIQNAKGGDGGSGDEDTPKPVEPNPTKKVGLTPLQTKQEELQTLLGFVGADVDHIIGKNTIAKYNALNLGLGITLSQTTPIEDLQKIIDAIVKKNKIEETSGAVKELQTRAKQLYTAWRANPTGVLMPNKDTQLVKIILDKTTNQYVSTGVGFAYRKDMALKREDLGVYRVINTFKWPYYVIFSDNKTHLMLANPKDWIIK